ncbi:unnamed protein product, partial [Allacma fusca]
PARKQFTELTEMRNWFRSSKDLDGGREDLLGKIGEKHPKKE